jgi:hypothetical protein
VRTARPLRRGKRAGARESPGFKEGGASVFRLTTWRGVGGVCRGVGGGLPFAVPPCSRWCVPRCSQRLAMLYRCCTQRGHLECCFFRSITWQHRINAASLSRKHSRRPRLLSGGSGSAGLAAQTSAFTVASGSCITNGDRSCVYSDHWNWGRTWNNQRCTIVVNAGRS